jgi:protease I
MTTTLDGRRIAFLVAMEGVEQVELTEPWRAMHEAGATTDLLSTEAGEIQALQSRRQGRPFPGHVVVSDADPDDYDAHFLPGGVANPDALRTDRDALEFDLPEFCSTLVEEFAEGRHKIAAADAPRS